MGTWFSGLISRHDETHGMLVVGLRIGRRLFTADPQRKQGASSSHGGPAIAAAKISARSS
jgi:hypothetical protein